MPTPFRISRTRALVALLLVGTVTACSADSDTSNTSDSSASKATETAFSHVHGLGIDPADGRLYVATHEGVLAVDKNNNAKRVSDTADYMGFTITGARTFLGSGHPAPGSNAPANRGLIESTDAGKTWKTRSLGGKVDFHSLEYAHDTIYGYDSTGGLLRVSKDGTTWDERARLAALDITVSPDDPDRVLATTQNGIATSTDGSKTFASGREPALAFLSWPKPDALYGIAPTGEVRRSTDNGTTWKTTGTVPGSQPQALTAVGADRILAATDKGIYESRDGGTTFTLRVPASG
ncbi:F510_1955 family glycosylhydrolase [Streptomyces sp. NPDC059002]|uniref:F510_1955 family glycosylhydrolase n=1 Tax=Streptomyces sp. NPDC059002 TaxID=3346690 RepID=UPI0036923DB7